MQLELKKFETVFFRYIMGICAFAMLVAIGMYAYLGIFSRYLSDDYCEAVVVRESNPIKAVINRYEEGSWRAANRYSNLMFAGFSDWFGADTMQITISSMVMLWAIGLSWSIHELRKFFKVIWSLQTDCFLGFTLGFFVLLQAPNLFQTIYWRSSMMTHFAPLVFGSFLFAFWTKQAAYMLKEKISLSIYLVIFFSTFIIAGFSEAPVTTMVTVLVLLILAVFVLVKSPFKEKLLSLLAWTFAGALFGLLVMIFSPASMNMVGNSSPTVFGLLRDSFLFSFYFIEFSLIELPLPNILSVLIPTLLIWIYTQFNPLELKQRQKRIIWFTILASPVVMWILIAAGFSPSVYGQGYPVERMRFLARTLMTATFMFEGSMLGLLAQNLQFKANRMIGQWVVVSTIVILGFVYPLRAALTVYRNTVPEYQTRAKMWDLRNAYIIRHAILGEKELVVPGYSGVHNIKELDDSPDHWVNICAAKFYGVNSIRTVSIPDENILEYLSE